MSRLAYKRFLVALAMVVAIAIAAWFIPAFVKELHGTFNCHAVGDVTVCWSVK